MEVIRNIVKSDFEQKLLQNMDYTDPLENLVKMLDCVFLCGRTLDDFYHSEPKRNEACEVLEYDD